MQITATVNSFAVTILDDHGNVALNYKVEGYNCSTDPPALVNGFAALVHHIQQQGELLCK